MSDFIENMETNKQSIPIVTSKMLFAGSALPQVPFYIELKGNDQPLLCKKVLRFIPHKRLVIAGVWGSVETVAKLFAGAKGKKNLIRESAGIKNLTFLNVLTPALLFQGTSLDKKIHILLLENINEALTLDIVWKTRPPGSNLFTLMRAMTIELATQHVKGVLQQDLHFKNFLIKNRRIYTIDAADLLIQPLPLAKKTSLENVALFLSQLGIGHGQLQKKLFSIYAQSRGWNIKERDNKRLTRYLKRWNESRLQDFWKKTQRSSTDFKKFSSWRHSGMQLKENIPPALGAWLQDPESLFRSAFKHEVLKGGNSATVIKVFDGASYYVVKRYNTKSLWHWLRRALRPTRASTGWQFGQLLNLFEIRTPRPIAFVEQRFLNFRGRSYLFMDYVEGPSLHQALKTSSHDIQQKLVKRTLALFRNLYRLKITHGDLKQSNLIVHENYPYLIDLDGMMIHKFPKNLSAAFRKDWSRFIKNWQDDNFLMDLFLQKN